MLKKIVATVLILSAGVACYIVVLQITHGGSNRKLLSSLDTYVLGFPLGVALWLAMQVWKKREDE